jgi:uncharacterized membrane protein YtjA (UPF0391 family)
MEPKLHLDVWFLKSAQHDCAIKKPKEFTMLYYALAFLLVAIVAAVFGFGGIASASAGIAQILFFIFLVLFIVTLIARAVRS